MEPLFPIGSVGHTLMAMRGVWHDRVSIFSLAGVPLADDRYSGTPGPAPLENLVYIDFDGVRYVQTNVAFRGREPSCRSFSGTMTEGVLVFDRLGPDAPEHIGVSGGPGVLIFSARQVCEAWSRYHEPDWVRLIGPGQRTRTTLLYRGGEAVRTLTAEGVKIAPSAERRVIWDPRGPDGPAHEPLRGTHVFARTNTD